MLGNIIKAGLKKDESNQKVVYKRQRTLPFDLANIQGEKRGDRFTIKNLLFNVKLKWRVQKLLSLLPTRKWKILDDKHFQRINDKSYWLERRKKKGGNEAEEEDESDRALRSELYMNRYLRSATKTFKKKSSEKQVWNYFKNLYLQISIINPNSLYKLLWDSFQSIITIIMSLLVPLKLSIQDYSLSYYLGSSTTLTFILISFIMDIFINLNTAFFKMGKIEISRIQILKNYLRQVGIYDLCITFTLFYEIISPDNYHDSLNAQNAIQYIFNIILCIFLYIKVLKLHKFMFKIEEVFSFKRRTLNILSLIKLLTFILKISHAFACIWLFIGRQTIGTDTSSWIKGVDEEEWIKQYLKAYYFISVTMTTIGYGDIVPKNAIETIVCIFTMMIACVIFGYTINSIGSIFVELKKEDEVKKENLLIINRYMNEKSISRELQSSIREYLEYYWKQQSNDSSEKEETILGQLSEDMRSSLLLQANRIILEDCQFFQKNFSSGLIKKLVHLIKQKKLTPNELIISSYEDVSKSGIIYFVESGEIDIFQEFSLQQMPETSQQNDLNLNKIKNNVQSNQNQTSYSLSDSKKKIKKVHTLHKGEYFGEVSFFTNFPSNFIIRSKNFSKVLYVERSKFIEFLQENHFNDDYETFCFIRDQISQNELSCLSQKCYFCNSFEHSAINCSTIHYYPYRTQAISRYNFSENILIRQKAVRRKVAFKNSFADIARSEQCARRIRSKNESFIEKNLTFLQFSESLTSSSSSSSQSSSDRESIKSIHKTNTKQLQFESDNDNFQSLMNLADSAERKESFDRNHAQNEKDEGQSNNLEIIESLSSIQSQDAIPSKSDKSEFPRFSNDKSILKKRQNVSLDKFHSEKNLENDKNGIMGTSNQHLKLEKKQKSDSIFFQNKLKRRQSNQSIQIKRESMKYEQKSSLKSLNSENKPKTFQIRQGLKGNELFTAQMKQLLYQNSLNGANSYKRTNSSQILIRKQNYEKMFEDEQIQKKSIFLPKQNPSQLIPNSDNNSIQLGRQFQPRLSQFLPQTALYQRWDTKFDQAFDIMKIFKNYYPSFNHDKILQKIKKKRLQEGNQNKPVSKWTRQGNRKSYTIVCNLLADSRKGRFNRFIPTPVNVQPNIMNSQQLGSSEITIPTESEPFTAASPINNLKESQQKQKRKSLILKKNQFQPFKSLINIPTSSPQAMILKTKANNTEQTSSNLFDEDFCSFSNSKISSFSPSSVFQLTKSATKIPIADCTEQKKINLFKMF